MDLFECIAKRHSYRGPFTDTPVPRDDLRAIVQAGIQAPSGCNAQTTTFVIVDDAEVLSKACDIIGAQRVPPALIACVVEPRAVFRDMSFELEDCSAAVENMLLAITAMGYATVWTDGALRVENRGRELGDLLGVPEGKRVQIVLPIGVPAESWVQREKLPFGERAWFNQYGQ